MRSGRHLRERRRSRNPNWEGAEAIPPPPTPNRFSSANVREVLPHEAEAKGRGVGEMREGERGNGVRLYYIVPFQI